MPNVSLSKVSLDKDRPSVSLEKRAAGFGDVRVNLNWNQGGAPSAGSQRPAGMLQRLFGGGAPSRSSAPSVDLDLGCLFETTDGQKGSIQALGGNLGRFDAFPYIQLSGDDRTGQNADGETMRINGEKFAQLRRVLVYAFIYEGAPNWDATDGVVTVEVPGEAPIEVRMTGGRADRPMCAVCLIENDGGRMKVTRAIDYFVGHQPMDQAHRWGLNWRTARKD